MTKPEERARQIIDGLLEAAGWKVQDIRDADLGASLEVAVREFPLKGGEVDYLLFADRKAMGVVEAKPEGVTLSGVAEQSAKYVTGLPANLPSPEVIAKDIADNLETALEQFTAIYSDLEGR